MKPRPEFNKKGELIQRLMLSELINKLIVKIDQEDKQTPKNTIKQAKPHE